MFYAASADAVALLHGALAVYALGGVALILVGLWRRWEFVRHFWFRFTHLMLCLVVEVFELGGQPCPLTSIEQWLREQAAAGSAYQGGYLAHYIHEAIHLDVPPRVLAVPTALLGLGVMVLYWLAGPRTPGAGGRGQGVGRSICDWRLAIGDWMATATSQEPSAAPMHRDAASRAVRRRLLTRLFPFSFFLFPFRARQAAPQPPGARPVTTVRKLLVVGGLCVLAVGLGPSYNALARAAAPVMGLSFGWTRALIFLLAGVLLCAWTPRACGWRLGETARWQRHGLAIAAVWVTTPLATIWLYAPFTDRPFCGYGIQFWLVETVAQELIFPGFVYARLVELWGEEREGWRGAFSPPMLILAVLFASWHWYNITFFTGAYVTAQIIYTFIGGWLVYQTRRWTGSLLPGIASHVVVNYLGCVM